MNDGFDAFLARAWDDHADQPEAVAERLRESGTPTPASAAQVSGLARLIVHLFGEHLGRFDDARERIATLARGAAADDSDARSALRVARATLDLAEGRPHPMNGLSVAESARAEGGAAAICVGRGDSTRGRALIASARERLAALPNALPGDHRPLAVACNNLAWTLIERGPARSPDDAAAMVEFARASREHWSVAGTWLEVERADHAIACALLASGALNEALVAAERCLAGCVAHDAPPHEIFFAHEALARVHHARGDKLARQHHAQAARTAFERLGSDDQAACRSALDALRG